MSSYAVCLEKLSSIFEEKKTFKNISAHKKSMNNAINKQKVFFRLTQIIIM